MSAAPSRVFLVAAIAAALGAAPVAAAPAAPESKPAQRPEDARRQLDAVEKSLKESDARKQELAAKADALEREIADLRARAVALAADERARDDELRRVEAALQSLAHDEGEQEARIDADRAALVELLGALQRLSRLPPEALAARPQAPDETVKTALLLRTAVPELKARADALAAQLKDLARTREALDQKRREARTARADLTRQEGELRDLVSRREALTASTQAEMAEVATHAAALTSQAGDLRDLVERLEAERRQAAVQEREAKRAQAQAERERKARERLAALGRTPRPAPPATGAPPAPPPGTTGETGGVRAGGLVLPVTGTLAQRYGESDAVGAVSRGVRIQTRGDAPVVAPYEGSVVFAGPFKGYGLILIVEHPNGYHSLIAGLGRIDTRVGQRVLTGEPLGAMVPDGSPTLYYELRRGGQPINPLRGFAGADNTARTR